jgi:hypothetical protein
MPLQSALEQQFVPCVHTLVAPAPGQQMSVGFAVQAVGGAVTAAQVLETHWPVVGLQIVEGP